MKQMNEILYLFEIKYTVRADNTHNPHQVAVVRASTFSEAEGKFYDWIRANWKKHPWFAKQNSPTVIKWEIDEINKLGINTEIL